MEKPIFCEDVVANRFSHCRAQTVPVPSNILANVRSLPCLTSAFIDGMGLTTYARRGHQSHIQVIHKQKKKDFIPYGVVERLCRDTTSSH